MQDNGFKYKTRNYADYQQYLDHQKTKLPILQKYQPEWIPAYDSKYLPVLTERLKKSHDIQYWHGKKVLCLGARQGTEVRAFRSVGAFAVGIDICVFEPEKNPYVMYGDFQHIEFPDNTVDVVFMNVMDHVYDAKMLIEEIKRVLVKGGLFITEIIDGADKRKKLGFFESMWWESTTDCVKFFESSGLTSVEQYDITKPWTGIYLQMRI